MFPDLPHFIIFYTDSVSGVSDILNLCRRGNSLCSVFLPRVLPGPLPRLLGQGETGDWHWHPGGGDTGINIMYTFYFQNLISSLQGLVFKETSNLEAWDCGLQVYGGMPFQLYHPPYPDFLLKILYSFLSYFSTSYFLQSKISQPCPPSLLSLFLPFLSITKVLLLLLLLPLLSYVSSSFNPPPTKAFFGPSSPTAHLQPRAHVLHRGLHTDPQCLLPLPVSRDYNEIHTNPFHRDFPPGSFPMDAKPPLSWPRPPVSPGTGEPPWHRFTLFCYIFFLFFFAFGSFSILSFGQRDSGLPTPCTWGPLGR